MSRPKHEFSCCSSILFRKGYACGWEAGVKKRYLYEKKISQLLD